MQTDHRVPTNPTILMRLQQQQQQQHYQHRKRSLSNMNARKRDRHDLICVVCHAPAMGKSRPRLHRLCDLHGVFLTYIFFSTF